MKRYLPLILISVSAFGQSLKYVPSPAAAFVSSTGLPGTWSPLTGSGGSNPLPYVPTPAGLYYSSDGTGNPGTWVPWTGSSASGTVTSVGTSSPITGGTITSTGTIGCATCVVASSPGAGLAHFAGSTQTVTSSAVNLASADVTGTLPLSNIVALPLSCQPGIGDGLNAIPAGTYLTTSCRNETGQTWTLTAIRCVADAGSSTCNVTNGAGTALLTGAITGTSSYANGTQSGTTTIASGDYLKVTYVADGTSKQIGIDVAGTY